MILPASSTNVQVREAFWRTVEECLVEFHQLSHAEAFRRVQDLRGRLDQPPLGLSGDLIYHDEPFDVACRIAGRTLDLASHRARYDSILAAYNW